MMVRKIQQV